MTSINRHFKREAKLFLFLPLLFIVLGLLAAIVVPNIQAWLVRDRCVKAGGTFVPETETCVFAEQKTGR
jgi:hypothetical protein